MTLEETAKYFKIEKSIPYKMAREGKIPAVKIEMGKNNKVISRILYDQELIRTVQAIFKQACKRAGINKKVTVHTLRHSFATHLLESRVWLKIYSGIA